MKENLFLEDLQFQSLGIEETVRQDRTVEGRFHYSGGVWWRKIRPFFYQPSFFFQPLSRDSCFPSRTRALVGYHCLVEDASTSNSTFKVLMHRGVREYSMETLESSVRRNIRKGLSHLTVRKIEDVGDLVNDGYDTFRSFRDRTGWGDDYKDRQTFAGYITRAFNLPKRFFLGIYEKDRLVAFSQPYVTEGLLSVAMLISHSDYQPLRPADILMHGILTVASRSPEVTRATFGPRSLKPTLDRFKMKFGFELVDFPTYAWLSPIAGLVIRKFHRGKFNQLFGLEQAPAGAAEAK